MYGNNEYCPELVDWIDTFTKVNEIPALKKEEIQKMIETTGNIDDMLQNDGGNKKYSPKRKYMWGGIGALAGALYGSGFSMVVDTKYGTGGFLHIPPLLTHGSMKVFLGYNSSYHRQDIDAKAFLLNSLLWAIAIGGTTYFFKRRKERAINNLKAQLEEDNKGNKIWNCLKNQIKKTRWAVMGFIFALGVGLPTIFGIVSNSYMKWWDKKPPRGYEQLLSRDRFHEMSCSPLEEKIVYSKSILKAGWSSYRQGSSSVERGEHETREEYHARVNTPLKLLNIKEQKTYDLNVKGFDPVWGPKGEWIYYTKGENDEPNIYKVRPNGQDNTLVEKGMASSSFSASGKMVKVDKEGYIWIGNEKTPFEGVEPFLIDEDMLVYLSGFRITTGNLKNKEESTLSSDIIFGDLAVPKKGPYRNKIIAANCGSLVGKIYVFDPKTGEETLLKQGPGVTDIDVSQTGKKLYVGLSYRPKHYSRGRTFNGLGSIDLEELYKNLMPKFNK